MIHQVGNSVLGDEFEGFVLPNEKVNKFDEWMNEVSH